MTLHPILADLIDRWATPGEDLVRALFEGAPNPITADVVAAIAEWVYSEGPSAWDRSEKYCHDLGADMEAAAEKMRCEVTHGKQ